MDRNSLMKFGEVRQTKHYTQISDKSRKKALVMKRSVHLEDGDKKYSEKMRIFTEEEIQKRHMGKMKCVVKFNDDAELIKILEMYYS